MRTRKDELVDLLRRCDYERGAAHWIPVGFTLSTQDRELLKTTARTAHVSQAGLLRVGLTLAVQAVAELGDA